MHVPFCFFNAKSKEVRSKILQIGQWFNNKYQTVKIFSHDKVYLKQYKGLHWDRCFFFFVSFSLRRFAFISRVAAVVANKDDRCKLTRPMPARHHSYTKQTEVMHVSLWKLFSGVSTVSHKQYSERNWLTTKSLMDGPTNSDHYFETLIQFPYVVPETLALTSVNEI